MSSAPEDLRSIRLYHWQKRGLHRAMADEYRRLDVSIADEGQNFSDSAAMRHDRLADMHLRYVLALNEFFPDGDTAEKG